MATDDYYTKKDSMLREDLFSKQEQEKGKEERRKELFSEGPKEPRRKGEPVTKEEITQTRKKSDASWGKAPPEKVDGVKKTTSQKKEEAPTQAKTTRPQEPKTPKKTKEKGGGIKKIKAKAKKGALKAAQKAGPSASMLDPGFLTLFLFFAFPAALGNDLSDFGLEAFSIIPFLKIPTQIACWIVENFTFYILLGWTILVTGESIGKKKKGLKGQKMQKKIVVRVITKALGKFGLAYIGELIPFLGDFFFWTLHVFWTAHDATKEEAPAPA